MKTPSLEKFYLQIHKAIVLAAAFTEIPELVFIIKSCRLKPLELFGEQRKKYNLKLYKEWFDEFGNSLNIVKNKRIKIIYNDLKIRNNGILTSTDLYFGLSIDKILSFSKIAHFIIGINEDTKKTYIMVTFLGVDNYLRSYIYDDSKWNNNSPLLLGLKRLKRIYNYLNIKYFHELSNKENFMTPCNSVTEWICCLPLTENFLNILKKRHDVDFSIFISKGLEDKKYV